MPVVDPRHDRCTVTDHDGVGAGGSSWLPTPGTPASEHDCDPDRAPARSDGPLGAYQLFMDPRQGVDVTEFYDDTLTPSPTRSP